MHKGESIYAYMYLDYIITAVGCGKKAVNNVKREDRVE